jgi:hypothetical protein
MQQRIAELERRIDQLEKGGASSSARAKSTTTTKSSGASRPAKS